MTISSIDWTIIIVYLVVCTAAGVWMRRYIRNVEDYAVAGRKMDVHLGVASLAATELGIVTVMYTAEMGFCNGLAGAVPGVFLCLAMLLVGITGFVIVPLRKAGVITIPELFEKRFGWRVRWLAGLVIVLGGVLNMGIFLRLGGEFLMYVTGVNPKLAWEINYLGFDLRLGCLELVMTSLLALVLFYTVLGGMVSVLVTDYLQFLVMGAGIVITSIIVVDNVGWPKLIEGLDRAHQAGAAYIKATEARSRTTEAYARSVARLYGEKAAEKARRAAGASERMALSIAASKRNGVMIDKSDPQKPRVLTMSDPFNPLKSNGSLWFLWQAIFSIAVMTTWQTTIARVLAARDAPTAKRVYRGTCFYFVGRFALPGLWGAAAFLYYSQKWGGLPPGVGSLTAMPQYLAQIMPVGLIGLLVAAMLAAEMSTDSGYLLTWATVIYNDLVTPCLNKPLSPRARLLVIRGLVVAIGVFLVFYGLWYELPGRAWDYLAVTGNIYLASVFTLLVGALYWPRANTCGAIAAIVLGAIGPLAFLVVNAIVKDPARQISPESAGLAAFGLSFAGMICGSLVAQALGRGNPQAIAVEEQT
jgi:Na+/proline symporter